MQIGWQHSGLQFVHPCATHARSTTQPVCTNAPSTYSSDQAHSEAGADSRAPKTSATFSFSSIWQLHDRLGLPAKR